MADTSARLRRWFGAGLAPPKIETFLQYLCRYVWKWLLLSERTPFHLLIQQKIRNRRGRCPRRRTGQGRGEHQR